MHQNNNHYHYNYFINHNASVRATINTHITYHPTNHPHLSPITQHHPTVTLTKTHSARVLPSVVGTHPNKHLQ